MDTNNDNGEEGGGDSLEYLYTTLKQASAQLDLKAQSSNEMIVLLGNTRAGKSTLRMLLCNNTKEFQQLQVIGDPPCIADPSGEIGDDSGFSRTTLPKTFYPSQMQNSQVAWVDASGWGCNRSTYTDIEGIYLLNQLANPTKKLKFLVVIPYQAFYPDADRKLRLEPFQFAAQITDHVTHEDSVGVVVTKVDSDAAVDSAMNNISMGLKSLYRRGDRESLLFDDDDDAAADNQVGDEDNRKMQKITAVVECVLRHNRICLVRRPQKRQGIKSQPLHKILTDPNDNNSKSYHETVCQHVLALCDKLVYACKREDFTVAFNDLMVMDLNTKRLPNIDKRMTRIVRKLVINLEKLVREHVTSAGGNVNKLEVVNTLTQALQQIPVDLGNPTAAEHLKCSQIIRRCSSCFQSSQESCSGLLEKLEELEERVYFLQKITPVSLTGKLESHLEIMRFRKELQAILKQILKEHERELRPVLERQIKKEVDDQVENMKKEYKTRHDCWLRDNAAAHEALAVSKVESHIASMNALLFSDLTSVEEGVMGQIYKVLALVITESIKIKLKSLNQTGITLMALGSGNGSSQWGQEPVRRMKQFLETLRKAELVAKWKKNAEPQIQKVLNELLDTIKDNWLNIVSRGKEENVNARIISRTKYLAALTSFLEAQSGLQQKMKTSIPNMSKEVAKFIEKLNKSFPNLLANFNYNTCLVLEQLGGAHFEDVEKNCCRFWNTHISQLQEKFQSLYSLYKFLGSVRTFVADSYDAQKKLRDMTLVNIMEPFDLLTHLSFPHGQYSNMMGLLAKETHAEEQEMFQEILKNVDIPQKLWLDEKTLLILAERSVNLSDFVNEEFDQPKKHSQLSIFIVAGETVFLDTDWIQSYGEIRTVFICASQLKCREKCRFTLVGPAGRGGLTEGNWTAVKSEDGRHWGANGKDGLDGGCGGQGANVCMLLENFEDCDNSPLLEINCDGGKGGFGMNGGNGHCGFKRSIKFINCFNQLKRNIKCFDRTFTLLCKHLGLQPPNFKDYKLNELDDMKISNWRLAKKVQYRLGTMLTFTYFTFSMWRGSVDDFAQHCFCSMLTFRNFVDNLWDTPNLFAPLADDVNYDAVKFNDIIEPLLRERLGSQACSQPDGKPCPVIAARYPVQDNNYFHRYISLLLLPWKQLNQPGIDFQPILEIGVGLSQKCQYLCKDLHNGNVIPRIKISRGNPLLIWFCKQMLLLKGCVRRLTSSGNESDGSGGKGGDGGMGGCPGNVKVYTVEGSVKLEHLSLLKVHSSHGAGGPPGHGGSGGEHEKLNKIKLVQDDCVDDDGAERERVKCHTSMLRPHSSSFYIDDGVEEEVEEHVKGHLRRLMQSPRENDGVPGKPTPIPLPCLRECKDKSDMWEMEISDGLWKAIDKTRDSNRRLLLSRLEAHDWSMQRQLFPIEYWVDEYLQISDATPTKLFTKSHLDVEHSFQKRLENFQQVTKVTSVDQGQVLGFLLKNSHDRTDALRKLVQDTSFVVNLEGALVHCKTAINNFQKSQHYVTCLKQQADFEQQLDKDIFKAKEQAEERMAKKMEEIEKTLTEQKERHREDLNDYVQLLEKKGMYEKLENVLKAFRIVMTPACGLATGVDVRRQVGERVGASMLLLLTKVAKPKVKNAEALVHNPINSLERLMKEAPRMVQRQIDTLEVVTREHADLNASLQGCLKQLEDMHQQLEKLSDARAVAGGSMKEFESARFLACLQKLEQVKKEMFAQIQKLRASYPATHKLASVLDYLHVDLITADTDVKLYKKTRDSVLESVSKSFWAEDAETSAAKQRRDMIDDKFVPAVDLLLSVVKSQLGGDPDVKIDKWQVKDMIKNLKEYLAHFVKGLPSEDQFRKAVEKIHELLDTRLKFYDRVRQREDTSRMATFIAGFHFNVEELEEYNISEEHKRKLAKIQLLTRAELLLVEYHSIKWAFLQWAFPYAEKYITKPIQDLIDVVQHLCSGDGGGDDNSTREYHSTPEENIVKAAVECVKLLNHFMDKRIKSGDSVSAGVDDVYFTNEFTVAKPFFEWRHDECGVEIRNLLLGQPTKFVADVKKSPLGKGAIKTNGSIQLRFSCRDKSQTEVQKELDTDLDQFLLEMVHSGDSRYRLGSNYYSLCGEKMALRGKVKTLGGDEGDCANDTRGKMKDFVLSPYTEWTFKLIPEDHVNSKRVLTSLADKFAHRVDLQLVGWGRYLIETGHVNNL